MLTNFLSAHRFIVFPSDNSQLARNGTHAHAQRRTIVWPVFVFESFAHGSLVCLTTDLDSSADRVHVAPESDLRSQTYRCIA